MLTYSIDLSKDTKIAEELKKLEQYLDNHTIISQERKKILISVQTAINQLKADGDKLALLGSTFDAKQIITERDCAITIQARFGFKNTSLIQKLLSYLKP